MTHLIRGIQLDCLREQFHSFTPILVLHRFVTLLLQFHSILYLDINKTLRYTEPTALITWSTNFDEFSFFSRVTQHYLKAAVETKSSLTK